MNKNKGQRENGQHSLAEHKEMAHRYLLQFQGYEEAADLVESRYELALTLKQDPEKINELRIALKAAQMKKKRIRRATIARIQELHCDEMKIVLWMIYVERKQPDEVGEWMHISEQKVTLYQRAGLMALNVPEDFYKTVRRRESGILGKTES